MNKFYRILGVDDNISDDELKAVHRSLLKRYHPDAYPGDKDYASKKTAEINEAYAEIVAFREKNNIKINKKVQEKSIKKEEKQKPQQNFNNFKEETKTQSSYDFAEEPKPQKNDFDYSNAVVENSAEIVSNKYKRELSKEEKRSKTIIDALIYSLTAITIGLILFMIFYK